MPHPPVYLDNHATTPLDPRVLQAMQPYLTTVFGNPASTSHSFGWAAAKAVQKARQQVAALIGAQPAEIVFTSGATESDNLAIKGVAFGPRAAAVTGSGRTAHLITSAIEHNAVLDPCQRLEGLGFAITRLGVAADGRLRLAQLEAALRPETVLVSVMAANNEIGVLQDMEAIATVTRPRGILFHSDATQAVGKVPVDVNAWHVDLLSLSGHKMYGPKGVGALYVRAGTELCCQQDGGGHEGGMRSGTLNVPGIVGLGAAAELARLELGDECTRIAALRDRLCEAILTRLDGVSVNGSRTHRVPHNLHLMFQDVEAEALMMSMQSVAVSSGSACSSASRHASHVLLAIGLSAEQAQHCLRFGLGRFTTSDDVDYAADSVVEAVQQLRQLSLP
ncbi:MAG: cysteine desulfurase family protein [Terriglobales bacterium]